MIDIEKLETLPRKQNMREKMQDCDFYRCRSNYPWKRVFRFLLSRVGQDFDKVTAEFVKLTWVPSQYRAFGQLAKHHIEVNTFFNDSGEICYYDRYSFAREACYKVSEQSEVFYVHPKTKLLCFQPRRKKINWKLKHAEEESKTLRILGDYHQLLKLNGIWYEIRGKSSGYYESLSPAFKRFSRPIGPRDRMIPQSSDNQWVNLPDANTIVITYQKQLSSKELKKFGLKNDVLPVKYGRLKG